MINKIPVRIVIGDGKLPVKFICPGPFGCIFILSDGSIWDTPTTKIQVPEKIEEAWGGVGLWIIMMSENGNLYKLGRIDCETHYTYPLLMTGLPFEKNEILQCAAGEHSFYVLTKSGKVFGIGRNDNGIFFSFRTDPFILRTTWK